jgi:large subunit ribosomal protein L16
MLAPKKTKFRKAHKMAPKGWASQKIKVAFGDYGLQALEGSWITSRQIESARRTITRFIQRGGKVWIRIFPDKPVTAHGNEAVMGSGKGAVDHYIAPVKAGTIMFEIGGIDEKNSRRAFELAGHKLPVKTKFVKRES